jgi:AbrB family looped-hinge helix DNA binding protein
MDAVTISTKYQVVIPLAVREQLHLRPGNKMQVILYDNRIVLIPVRPIEEARGSLAGINTDVPRDEEDRV